MEDACYELHMDQGATQSTFTIATGSTWTRAIAIFTEHLPSEFEASVSRGLTIINPVATYNTTMDKSTDDDDDDEPCFPSSAKVSSV